MKKVIYNIWINHVMTTIPRYELINHLCWMYDSALSEVKATVLERTRLKVGDKISQGTFPRYDDKPVREIGFLTGDNNKTKQLLEEVGDDENLENLVGFAVKINMSERTLFGIPFIVGDYKKGEQNFTYVANCLTGWEVSKAGLLSEDIPEEVFAGLISGRSDVLGYLEEVGTKYANGYLVAANAIPKHEEKFQVYGFSS